MTAQPAARNASSRVASLIHALALVVSRIRQGAVDPWLFANHPMGNPPAPDGYAWSLSLLYFPCRSVARRRDRWLGYL